MTQDHGEQEHSAGDDFDASSHHGASSGLTLTVRPGETAFGSPGNDTIDISPVIGGGAVTGDARATVFAGPGNDTIVDGSVKESTFPVTADGGPGNDTFVALSVSDAQTSFFTGGPGHDLFEFSTQPFHGADNVTITDFSRHDAIQLDVNTLDLPNIAFTDHGSFTEVAATANGAQVDLHLTGHFDPAKFHVTNDGQGHEFITYGHAGDWFLT